MTRLWGQGALGVTIAAAVAGGVWLGAAALTGSGPLPAPEPAPVGPGPDVVVYKSRTCGCCDGWIRRIRAAGYRMVVRDTGDVGAVKRRLGVPQALHSCQTAVLAGYVVEGHVPAAAIARLLEDRPAIAGLAVPGTPTGPHYDVVAFHKNGRTSVFGRFTED